MPYSHYDDPNSWRASTIVILRLLNFFPFNVGAGFYYGLGSSKYSHSIFDFGSLLSARLRLFGFFIEGKFLKDFEERKGSNSDASLLYHSKFQEYQAVIGFTSEGFFW